eukprot:12406201-Karenia_brevis.AAC.1
MNGHWGASSFKVRTIAVVQTMPIRAKILKDEFVVAHPSAKEQLGELEHQIVTQKGELTCQRWEQMWKSRRHYVGE